MFHPIDPIRKEDITEKEKRRCRPHGPHAAIIDPDGRATRIAPNQPERAVLEIDAVSRFRERIQHR